MFRNRNWMVTRLVSCAILVLAGGLFTPHAWGTIMLTVYPASSTVADIKVTGNVDATTGNYNITGTPRPYILTLLHTGGNPLFATVGAPAVYTWNVGTTTLATSNGGVPNTGSHYGTWNGGLGSSSEVKLNIAMSANPVAGTTTITGTMEDVTLPAGFTWQAVGATGTLRNGSANTGNSVATIGTWLIASAASSTFTVSPGGGTITLPTIITGATSPSSNITTNETGGAAGNYNVGAPSGNFLVGNNSNPIAITSGGSNTHAVTYANTALVGPASGSVAFTSGTSTLSGSGTVSLAGLVLDHADSEFVGGSGNSLTLNLGTLGSNSGVHSLQYQIQNLLATYRAGLTLDSILEVTDPSNDFSTNATPFANLAPGTASSFFDVFFDTTGLFGSYSAHYQFNLHDDHAYDALGGTSQQLDLFVTADVVPEPSSMVLAASGLAGLGLFAWRRGKRGNWKAAGRAGLKAER